MPETIGPFTLDGTPAQNDLIRAMAKNLAAKLALPDGTSRLAPSRTIFKPNADMPEAAPGVKARGYWKDGLHEIWMNANVNAYPVAKTWAHEAMHQMDDDWLLGRNRADIRDLMVPEPASWRGEQFAVYGSAAIAGFRDPPYTDFYKGFVIAEPYWDVLAKLALRDNRPVPPPIDPNPALVEQVAALTAQVDALNATLTQLQTGNQEIAAQSLELANIAQGGTA